jgi:hypothetical protein
MTKTEFENLIDEQFAEILRLTKSKGEEYSRSDDQLANFKRGAADLGLLPEQIWAVYFSKHIDSIKSYVKNLTNPNAPKLSEPIEGRIDDAILYLLLLKGLIRDKE